MKRSRPTTLEPISAAAIVIVALHLAAVFGFWWWWQNVENSRRAARELKLAWMNPADFKADPSAITAPRSKPLAAAPAASRKAATAAAPKPAAAPTPPPAEAPVQKATLVAAPPQQHAMEPVPNPDAPPLFAGGATAVGKPSANRSITLRRAHEKRPGTTQFGTNVPPMTSPTLMDIARLSSMRPSAVPPPGAITEEEVNLDIVDEAVNTAFLANWTAPPIESVPTAQREARMNISIGKDGTVLKAQMNKFSGSHALDQSILEAADKVKKISTTLPSNYSKDSYDLELNFLLLP
ncbi:MAG: hypothetical protein B7Z37_06710 [Verrucomicrobia bacterium 12-59-8]|nr:MAG: hypothetical protein B7Z37_06710 [Verrucomicrobia bacterium 12-59-8]